VCSQRNDCPSPIGSRHVGKRVQFDEETSRALDLLARDNMKTFQELVEKALADLLKKHGRPIDLKSALRQSVREAEQSDSRPPRPSPRKRG
jgi:hypothetical protein